MYSDKTLTCRDCGAEFVFTASEQEFYAQKGFTNEPGRCPACRAARKAQGNSRMGSRNSGGRREMFPAVCAACGVETEVPFRPSSDRPVYCRDCFDRNRR
ncbi:MAG: zinc-ribbon domain containing protein [Bacillota bacterium]|jgi:CxxC-x17-CxxC domain-containing protein